MPPKRTSRGVKRKQPPVIPPSSSPEAEVASSFLAAAAAAASASPYETRSRTTTHNSAPGTPRLGDGGQEITGETEEGETAEEAKLRESREEDEQMVQRWTEEYFEIVEQLPLELHRCFALMHELEVQMQTCISAISNDTRRYRESRQALKSWMDHRAAKKAGKRRDMGNQSINGAHKSDIEMADVVGMHTARESTELQEDTDETVDAAQRRTSDPDDAQSILDPEKAEDSRDPQQSTSTSAARISSPSPAMPPSRAQREVLLRAITESSAEAVRAAEEKVGLAVTAYNWVDRHIRRLDGDLQKSESALLLGLRTGTEESRGVRGAVEGIPAEAGSADGTSTRATTGTPDPQLTMSQIVPKAQAQTRKNTLETAQHAIAATEASPASRGRGRGGTAVSGAPTTLVQNVRGRGGPGAGRGWRGGMRGSWRTWTEGKAALGISPSTSPSAFPAPDKPATSVPAAIPTVASSPFLPGDPFSRAQVGAGLVPDMAIDPNEPRYCYCDQVSYGDMVACDNDDCPREWFHYGCVGLTQPPRGKWYCLHCAPPGWKGPGMNVPPGAVAAPPGYGAVPAAGHAGSKR